MFEKASRLKLRFNYKGLCTVEDLWDIPMKGLDSIFKALNTESKAEKEESLLDVRSEANTELDLKLGIVKHVAAVRLLEQKAREDAATKAARKQQLLEIIARKQDAALEQMSVDELTKLVEEL